MSVQNVGVQQSHEQFPDVVERRLVSQIELMVSMIGLGALGAVLVASLLLTGAGGELDSFGAWFAFGLAGAMAVAGGVLVYRAAVNRRSGLEEATDLAGSLERMRAEGFRPPAGSDLVARGVAVRHALHHSGDVDLAERLDRALPRL